MKLQSAADLLRELKVKRLELQQLQEELQALKEWRSEYHDAHGEMGARSWCGVAAESLEASTKYVQESIAELEKLGSSQDLSELKL